MEVNYIDQAYNTTAKIGMKSGIVTCTEHTNKYLNLGALLWELDGYFITGCNRTEGPIPYLGHRVYKCRNVGQWPVIPQELTCKQRKR
jgi:hypothetical protein